MKCNLCDSSVFPLYNGEWCTHCEEQRLALGQAFMDETGSTWLYDKGEFVLRKVRELLKHDWTA